MKLLAALLLAACGLFVAESPSSTQEPSRLSCCSLVEEALVDYSHIKAGMTREEVEENFEHGGGLNSEVMTRYWYRKCHEIQVVIDFKAKHSKSTEPYSPHDIVEKKSQLMIDFTLLD